jgi:hypothetical protein
MAKAVKKARKPKAAAAAKGAKASKAAGSATDPPQNLIFVTDDGQVVVATSGGQVEIVSDPNLATQLKNLLLQRQQAAQQLTALLEGAGYNVIAGSTTSTGGP